MNSTTTVFLREGKPDWFLGSASEYASLKELQDQTPLGSRKDLRGLCFCFLLVVAILITLPWIGLGYFGLRDDSLLLPVLAMLAVVLVVGGVSRTLEHSTDNWPADGSFQVELRRCLRFGLIDLSAIRESGKQRDKLEALIVREIQRMAAGEPEGDGGFASLVR